MLRLFFLLLTAAVALPRSIAATSLSVSSFDVNEDGSPSVTIDDPSVGVLDMILLDIASPEYSEFYVEGGQMRQIATTTPDAKCAYAGVPRDSEEVATATVVSCGVNGPRLSVSFVNGTVIKMKKIGEGTSLEGAYDVRADVAGLTGGLNLSYAYFEQLAGSRSNSREATPTRAAFVVEDVRFSTRTRTLTSYISITSSCPTRTVTRTTKTTYPSSATTTGRRLRPRAHISRRRRVLASDSVSNQESDRWTDVRLCSTPRTFRTTNRFRTAL